ncbi:MAG: head-tail connector protein [Eubacterium sp.]
MAFTLNLDLKETKDYLRVDYTDDDLFIGECILASAAYIEQSVGQSFKKNDHLKELASIVQKKIISDLYEKRETTVNDYIKQSIIVRTIFDMLALEEL